jgi:pimeloyl-ACP methyl ester carboxylesterase
MPKGKSDHSSGRLHNGAWVALWVLLLGAVMVGPSNLSATSLLSEDLRLHVPWLSYEDVVLSADMTVSVEGNAIFFTLTDVGLRSRRPVEGALAVVGDDFSVHLPVVSFFGELYSADLAYVPSGADMRFVLTGAMPALSLPTRGAILSVTHLFTESAEEFPWFVSEDVSFFKVTFQTVDPFGQPTTGSGLLAIPVDPDRPAPLLSYQHGTLLERSGAPTAAAYDPVAVVMAGKGYVVAAPDFLGFGDSSGRHPFVHAKTLAASVIDMLRAVRTYCREQGILLNGQLFLAGYSEGGYATMAAAKEMETNYPAEFTITASAPSAGPYDLSGTTLQNALSADRVPNPFYYPYTYLAYNDIYGFVDAEGDLFAPEYAELVPQLFDGTHDGEEINAVLPPSPRELLDADLLQALEVPEPHPLKTALRENDVYRWVPQAPMRLYHCADDRDVPYANSLVAYSYFVEHHAQNVELVSFGLGDHATCVVPVVLSVLQWFDSLKE